MLEVTPTAYGNSARSKIPFLGRYPHEKRQRRIAEIRDLFLASRNKPPTTDVFLGNLIADTEEKFRRVEGQLKRLQRPQDGLFQEKIQEFRETFSEDKRELQIWAQAHWDRVAEAHSMLEKKNPWTVVGIFTSPQHTNSGQ